MDPFTQRMIERARARQEKIDQKLASSGQTVPKRKPLSENSLTTPVKSPIRLSKECIKTQSPVKLLSQKSVQKREQEKVSSPKVARDVRVTKKEFKSPRRSNSSRKSDVSVEINIMHRDNIQIEVQVEEKELPLAIEYSSPCNEASAVVIQEIEDDSSQKANEMDVNKESRSGLRHNVKSRLDRLGVLYSDKPELSSPIHRTETDFNSETPPLVKKDFKPEVKGGTKKFGRLAALADQINNWEDDLSHHNFHPEPTKASKSNFRKHETSTLDVSIHSYKDINKALHTQNKVTNNKQVNTRTYKKGANLGPQQLDRKIVAELESEGYRRVSTSQSRLVYDFSTTKFADPDRQEPKGASSSPRRTAAPKMAATVVSQPPMKPAIVAKKPSIKKYKAPTPPRNVVSDNETCESVKDKENNAVEREQNENDATSDDCIQTTEPGPGSGQVTGKGSPLVRRLAPKFNGNVDRNSVLSKAAMFEAGSPKAKDPAEMSLRERKALFEKNKGAAIVPKAPFGQAPSVKSLRGDKAEKKAAHPIKSITNANVRVTSTKSATNSIKSSKEDLHGDNISQSSVGGGIKGKLAALFSKEQTISERTIANKFKEERDKEMEMLQTRFNYEGNKPQTNGNESDDNSEQDLSEQAPLMGSSLSLAQVNRRPEIIGKIPKVTFEDLKSKSDTALVGKDTTGKSETDRVVGVQPVKRRNSQDSLVVLSVLDDVKRIKVNGNKSERQTNGVVVQQPSTIYPHLSDIETDASQTPDENSDCGSSTETEGKLNKSDNWAETSFGRDVMNVVKKNNSSYNKAIRNCAETDSSVSNLDSDLEDILDEALNEEESEGPTPPKINKNDNSLSSKSFSYKQGSPVRKEFKSPLKITNTPARGTDKGNELVHSVSFYRRMQNASSQPSTPLRVIRRTSPERDTPSTPHEPELHVTTVRERIKELQSEITKQQTVISQASQALNLCASTIEFSGSTEQAEGERLLLLATHRRQACLHEMQRLQVEGAGPAARAGCAGLLMRDLRLPLRRDYIRQLNADGAVGHHAVCLLKCRDRVLATSMQLTQPNSNTLHFPDEIRMDGLTSDFKVTVEVYLLQASKEELPHDVKYHISHKKVASKLLTPKSKGNKELKTPKIQSPAGPHSVRSPQFQSHGYCIFALPQANRKNFTLSKVTCGSPLEGTLSVDISAKLRLNAPAPHSAFLTAFDDVSGLGAWHRRWFMLQPPRLSYWKYPDDVQKKMPIGDIDLSTVISEKATRAPRDLCARPHTILLESAVPAGLIVPESGSLVYMKRSDGSVVRRHLLAADTAKDRDKWLECLNNALEYVRCSSTGEE